MIFNKEKDQLVCLAYYQGECVSQKRGRARSRRLARWRATGSLLFGFPRCEILAFAPSPINGWRRSLLTA
jgi:hypothetical protein